MVNVLAPEKGRQAEKVDNKNCAARATNEETKTRNANACELYILYRNNFFLVRAAANHLLKTLRIFGALT